MGWIQASREKAVWEKTDDEIVLIHSESSAYYGLNSIGAWLWECMLQRPRTEGELVDLLVQHMHQTPEEAMPAVADFVFTLREADLIVEQDREPAGDTIACLSAAPTVYEAPTLVKFGNLETLFLSGE